MNGDFYSQIKSAAISGAEITDSPPDGLKTGNRIWLRKYKIAHEFIGFQGHFDGHPVLPALAQVLIAKESVETILNREVTIKSIIQGKFISQVQPDNIISVYAAQPDDASGDEWRFNLMVSTSDGEGRPASFMRLKID